MKRGKPKRFIEVSYLAIFRFTCVNVLLRPPSDSVQYFDELERSSVIRENKHP